VSAVSSLSGVRASISEPKRAALLVTIFVDFLNSKNDFLHKDKRGACKKTHEYTNSLYILIKNVWYNKCRAGKRISVDCHDPVRSLLR